MIIDFVKSMFMPVIVLLALGLAVAGGVAFLYIINYITFLLVLLGVTIYDFFIGINRTHSDGKKYRPLLADIKKRFRKGKKERRLCPSGYLTTLDGGRVCKDDNNEGKSSCGLAGGSGVTEWYRSDNWQSPAAPSNTTSEQTWGTTDANEVAAMAGLKVTFTAIIPDSGYTILTDEKQLARKCLAQGGRRVQAPWTDPDTSSESITHGDLGALKHGVVRASLVRSFAESDRIHARDRADAGTDPDQILRLFDKGEDFDIFAYYFYINNGTVYYCNDGDCINHFNSKNIGDWLNSTEPAIDGDGERGRFLANVSWTTWGDLFTHLRGAQDNGLVFPTDDELNTLTGIIKVSKFININDMLQYITSASFESRHASIKNLLPRASNIVDLQGIISFEDSAINEIGGITADTAKTMFIHGDPKHVAGTLNRRTNADKGKGSNAKLARQGITTVAWINKIFANVIKEDGLAGDDEAGLEALKVIFRVGDYLESYLKGDAGPVPRTRARRAQIETGITQMHSF